MYQKGRIKFLERAPKIARAEVMVIFPEEHELPASAMDDEDRALLTQLCEELEPMSLDAEGAHLRRKV
jgi:hypothetical protein